MTCDSPAAPQRNGKTVRQAIVDFLDFKRNDHWLRHTFVRWCLDNNISTENIAILIGDNVATVAQAQQRLDSRSPRAAD